MSRWQSKWEPEYVLVLAVVIGLFTAISIMAVFSSDGFASESRGGSHVLEDPHRCP